MEEDTNNYSYSNMSLEEQLKLKKEELAKAEERYRNREKGGLIYNDPTGTSKMLAQRILLLNKEIEKIQKKIDEEQQKRNESGKGKKSTQGISARAEEKGMTKYNGKNPFIKLMQLIKSGAQKLEQRIDRANQEDEKRFHESLENLKESGNPYKQFIYKIGSALERANKKLDDSAKAYNEHFKDPMGGYRKIFENEMEEQRKKRYEEYKRVANMEDSRDSQKRTAEKSNTMETGDKTNKQEREEKREKQNEGKNASAPSTRQKGEEEAEHEAFIEELSGHGAYHTYGKRTSKTQNNLPQQRQLNNSLQKQTNKIKGQEEQER